MPPTQTRTSVGLETPQQTVDRARSMTTGLATSQTPQQVQSTGFKVDVPRTIPSTTLQSDQTVADVFARRNEMEQEQGAATQFNTDFNNLMGRVQAPLGATPFQNPQQFIEQTLLRRPTDTQTTLDAQRQTQADTMRGFAGELNATQQQATEQFGLPGLQQNLADTRNRIAERTTQLRETLRDFETNAERRGVAREFVQSEKGKVQADAAAELADLAIIESAQAGNVAMAQADIDRAVNAKMQAFEFENAAIQTEIQRLEAMDTRESQARSEQLQIALQERNRNIEQAIADEKQKLTYLSEAAANGADQGTLDAIRRATNVGEAAMMAGPFIGRLDRMQAEAQTDAIYENLRLRQDELDLAREKFEAESTEFGSGTITMQNGEKAVVTNDGTVTPISQIDFNDPAQVDALPVSQLTKAVIQGFAKTKDFTPTQKAEIASELQAIGFNPNTYVTNKLAALAEAWTAIPETSRGYLEGLKFWESKTNPEVAAFESQKTLLTREIARLFDVGVLSDQDVASYKDAMPSRQDSDLSVVLNKAAGISGAASGTNVEGVGKFVQLPDGRTAIVGLDGDTLLDPATGKPLE